MTTDTTLHTSMSTRIDWSAGALRLQFRIGDHPVHLSHLSIGTDASAVTAHALVDLFTAAEQRGRTSQSFVRSAIGERLRYVDHDVERRNGLECLRIRQLDDLTQLVVMSEFRVHAGSGMQVTQTVHNGASEPIVLTAVGSLSLELADAGAGGSGGHRVLWGESEWLAESRWHEQPLDEVLPELGLAAHGQDGRGRFVRSSHGSWSSGEVLPTGVLVSDDGPSLAWQLETSAGWSWELTRTQHSVVLAALGPSDLEHQFAMRLEPGASFTTVPVGLVVADGGRDAVFAALTDYRRGLRHRRPIDDTLPVIYNDYMNTLMGAPSTEALLPLIDAAAHTGAEYFCIDAGWFTDAAEYWREIGAWREAPTRFSGGLGNVIDRIHERGMRSGIWLEPEVVGIESPIARELPADAFFSRFGERVMEDHRYHLDFRHPAARNHLDETVDHLVSEYGVSYFKLDYNINPGVGTDTAVTGAGAGLLGHTRAFRSWLLAAQERHPEVIFENCASGAMRMDYGLLSVAHLQSTSDQQDALLYPPIAAAAPASMTPEQAANWAYPAESMSDEETAFAMTAGITGRLMLSGFLHRLRPAQLELVHEAVELHRGWRDRIASSHPLWPLGLPGWNDDVLALTLQNDDTALLAVWSRGAAQRVRLPGLAVDAATQAYPVAAAAWATDIDHEGTLHVEASPGAAARVFELRLRR
ncbi:glycoside hydrolase family 36 protein [Agromyces sp. NPDC056965]|uniref:glycoside hydrolase family 36 protein n=1 Tax=Agromyces sp. NPDC056965 TaxID=3345983 RepID=UPI003635F7E1